MFHKNIIFFFGFHNLTVQSHDPETMNSLSFEISIESTLLSCLPTNEIIWVSIFQSLIVQFKEPETSNKLFSEMAIELTLF